MEIASIMLLLVIITNVAICAILQAQVSRITTRLRKLEGKNFLNTCAIDVVLKRLKTIERKGEEA